MDVPCSGKRDVQNVLPQSLAAVRSTACFADFEPNAVLRHRR
jgi:hypothetical protein